MSTQLGNANANIRYINEFSKALRLAVKDFEKRDQRSILRAAARPIVKSSRSLAPKSDQVHYRYKKRRGNVEKAARAYLASRKTSKKKSGKNSGGRKGVDKRKIAAAYVPGNLRKSLKTLVFRRSPAVFVGPKQGGRAREVHGTTSANADGYYAQMIYGSAAAFQARVLIPALRAGRSAALRKAEEIVPKIVERARKRGIR